MEFESVMMAKAALDYLTICIEVLTQVRARDREKRREEERRESNDEKTIASAARSLRLFPGEGRMVSCCLRDGERERERTT